MQTLDSIRCPLKHDDGRQATHVAFSPDSSRFLSCRADNAIRVRDAISGDASMGLRPDNNDVPTLAAEFPPDGSTIVSVTGDELIQVWRDGDGQLLTTAHGRDKQLRGMTLLVDGTARREANRSSHADAGYGREDG